jgi:hypothetical protein
MPGKPERQIEVGDRVRFQPKSKLPDDWNMPRDAVGTVTRSFVAEDPPRRLCLDVEFGADIGFLAGADAAEFQVL